MLFRLWARSSVRLQGKFQLLCAAYVAQSGVHGRNKNPSKPKRFFRYEVLDL